MLFKGRAPAPVVQKLARHKELWTTARHAHVVDEQLRAAVEVFGRGNSVETTG